MSLIDHERARKLLRARRVEGISTSEGQWLDAHLAACDECSKEALAWAEAIGSLRALGATAPDEVVRRTRLAVHRRAEERRAQREPAVFLWGAAALISMWTILMTPYTWAGFAWLGRAVRVSDMTWQIAFLVWWFLPATVLGAVVSWQHVSRMNWRSL